MNWGENRLHADTSKSAADSKGQYIWMLVNEMQQINNLHGDLL